MTGYEPPLGVIEQHEQRLYHARCLICSWQLRKRRLDDLIGLLRSHTRIAHPTVTYVYREERP